MTVEKPPLVVEVRDLEAGETGRPQAPRQSPRPESLLQVPGRDHRELASSKSSQRSWTKILPWPGRPSSWWWWWEIGACIVSVVSLVLLLVLLARINTTPVAAWPFQTRPTTFIAIIMTTTHTTMLVPVAACISQLKWRHYLLRPDRLHHLQLFDGASRGPWGAAKALLRLRTKAALITVLAVVTVVSLAMEPLAQQMLDQAQRRVVVTNSMGNVAVAYDYDSYSTGSDGSVALNAMFVRATLMKTFIHEVFQPNSNCWNATSVCHWDELTTLGICRETRNMTGEAKLTMGTEVLLGNAIPAEGPSADNSTTKLQTRYKYAVPRLAGPKGWQSIDSPPEPNPFDFNIDMVFHTMTNTTEGVDNSSLPNGIGDGLAYTKTLFNSTAKMEQPSQNGYSEGVSYAFIRLPGNNQRVIDDEGYQPKPDIFVTRWYYCIQTFRDVEIAGTNKEMVSKINMTSQPLRFSSYGTSSNTSKKAYNIYKDDSGSRIYNISHGPAGTIWHTLVSLLNNRTLLLKGGINGSDPIREGTGSDPDYGQYLYAMDQDALVQRIAVAATNLIRSGWTWTQGGGDNGKSVMVPAQKTFNEELYFVVHWELLVVPALEVVAVVVLLVISIMKTNGQPLLKESVAAYLFHGLQGYTDGELQALVPEEESMNTLEEISQVMVVSLAKDEFGRLRFQRASGVAGMKSETALHIMYSRATTPLEGTCPGMEDMLRRDGRFGPAPIGSPLSPGLTETRVLM